jgi:hypothetical protein
MNPGSESWGDFAIALKETSGLTWVKFTKRVFPNVKADYRTFLRWKSQEIEPTIAAKQLLVTFYGRLSQKKRLAITLPDEVIKCRS